MSTSLVVLIYLFVGLFAGFLAGLFGIGGGTILVPVFLVIFPLVGIPSDLMMHIAVCTSLALIIPTAVVSSWDHYRSGHLDFSMAAKWVPGLCVGVVIGALCIHLVSPFVLKSFFTLYLLVCFLFTFFKKEGEEHNLDGPGKVFSSIVSFLVGSFSTMLGTGGGTFTVPILLYCNYPLKRTIAISSLTGFFIGAIGASVVVFLSYDMPGLPDYFLGYINLIAFFAVAPTAMLAANWGTEVEEHMEKHHLNRLYTLFLFAAFVVMCYHLVA